MSKKNKYRDQIEKQRASGAKMLIGIVGDDEQQPVSDDVIELSTNLGNALMNARDSLAKGKHTKAGKQIAHLIDDVDTHAEQLSDDIIINLISCGKTSFECVDVVENIIPTPLYNTLIGILESRGLTEPSGWVMGDKKGKGRTKVATEHEELHNNLPKSNRLKKDSSLPEGVKGDGCLEEFCETYDGADGFSASIKVDGVSAVLTVDDKGVVTSAQTRGTAGVSVNIGGLIGKKLSKATKAGGYQVEVFVNNGDLKAITKALKREYDYASPRHAATGMVALLTDKADATILKYLKLFHIANTVGLDPATHEFDSPLKGSKLASYWKAKDFESLSKQILTYEEYCRENNIPADGVVVTANVAGGGTRKGRTNLNQIAHKFTPRSAMATVDNVISIEPSLKGYRSIVVGFKAPVTINGGEYTKQVFSTAKQFFDMDIRVGSVLELCLVGDSIPGVAMDYRGDGEKLVPPSECECCGGTLYNDDGTLYNGKLYCFNHGCEDNRVGRMANLIQVLGVEGAGVQSVKNWGLTGTIADNIKAIEDADMSSCSKPQWEVYLGVRDALSNLTDIKAIVGTGIPKVADANARKLLAHYGSTTTDDVLGEIVDHVKKEYSEDYASDLEALFSYVDEPTSTEEFFKPRVTTSELKMDNELLETIESCGFVASKDKGSFAYLIVSDAKIPTTTKVDRARNMEKKTGQKVLYTRSEFINNPPTPNVPDVISGEIVIEEQVTANHSIHQTARDFLRTLVDNHQCQDIAKGILNGMGFDDIDIIPEDHIPTLIQMIGMAAQINSPEAIIETNMACHEVSDNAEPLPSILTPRGATLPVDIIETVQVADGSFVVPDVKYIKGENCVARADKLPIKDENGVTVLVDITNTILTGDETVELYNGGRNSDGSYKHNKQVDVGLIYTGSEIKFICALNCANYTFSIDGSMCYNADTLKSFIVGCAKRAAMNHADDAIVLLTPFKLIDESNKASA